MIKVKPTIPEGEVFEVHYLVRKIEETLVDEKRLNERPDVYGGDYAEALCLIEEVRQFFINKLDGLGYKVEECYFEY